MGKINYKAIYEKNKHDWFEMTNNPQKYEALLAGHYSERNHFVYELLQNAEDARATKVVIEYYPNKLIFYHNGKPFDTNDVIGVSSMLMGTKDSTDAQTIGRFGMGFKSVFKYTYRPEIYSDDEAFRISNYLLPEELNNGWNYKAEKRNLICKTSADSSIAPFKDEEHLTKFIIPFEKINKKGEIEEVNGTEVLLKLRELKGEILLFLSHIQSLYWVNKTTGLYSYITAKQDEKDENLFSCRIEGSNQGEKEEITKYIKFTKLFNHPEMKNAEVSVAYKLNSRGDNINELPGTDICVYFPTREKTDLPFLVHGSFETAVSREKLMTPSSFNDDLFAVLGNLIAETLPILAKRKLLTQAFIRNIVMPAFQDEEKNETIPGLRDKITESFKKDKIIPTSNGDYQFSSDCYVPLPFQIANFTTRSPFDKTLEGKYFVAINNDSQANFQTYFWWLVMDLEIPMYSLIAWAEDMEILEETTIEVDTDEFENLKYFYDFLSDHKESVYLDSLSYFKKGNYEREIRKIIAEAWTLLRRKPLILNQEMELVPAFDENGDPCVYLRASSELRSIVAENLVAEVVDDVRVLREGFHIPEFNDMQYIKEKIINKYVRVEDSVEFENSEDIEEEYASDIKQILSVISNGVFNQDLLNLLSHAYIIKPESQSEDQGFSLCRPVDCYLPKTFEGLNMSIYLEGVCIENNKIGDTYYDSCIADMSFYIEHGISAISLTKLGVKDSPVIQGEKYERGTGSNYWTAIDDFCPNIQIIGLLENLQYIEHNPDDKLSHDKSAEILQFLLNISGKLKGQRSFRKNNPYLGPVESSSLYRRILKYRWLYDSNRELHSTFELSRYELDSNIYGLVQASDKAYQLLGFAEKEIDTVETTFRRVDDLDEEGQRKLLETLAKRFGMELSKSTEKKQDDWDDEDDFFNPNDVQDDSFPERPVRNRDYLKRHVYEQFYCADPVTYENVLRRIRTSKSTKTDRAYVEGMYVNASNKCVCQICKKVTEFHETIQIANYGIEMPQLNLCLCRDCAARYKAFCLHNKNTNYNDAFRDVVLGFNTDTEEALYTIELEPDLEINFTQTHIVELQEIFDLIYRYGLPKKVDESTEESVARDEKVVEKKDSSEKKESPEKKDNYTLARELKEKLSGKQESTFVPSIVAEVDAKESAQGTEAPDDVAKEGSFVSYKKLGPNMQIMDNIMSPKKYPLHKAMEGHRPGDVVYFLGKKYEIISVIND